jgi:hypothetical protein
VSDGKSTCRKHRTRGKTPTMVISAIVPAATGATDAGHSEFREEEPHDTKTRGRASFA